MVDEFDKDFIDAVERNDAAYLKVRFDSNATLIETLNSPKGPDLIVRALGKNAPEAAHELIRRLRAGILPREEQRVPLLHHQVTLSTVSKHEANALRDIEFFLQHGFGMEDLDEWGCTPLHRAYELDAVQAVELLLKYKADATRRDKENITPSQRGELHRLLNACITGSLPVVREVLASHAQLASTPNHYYYSMNTLSSNETALFVAARHNHSEIIRYLVTVPGVSVQSTTQDGYTALHTAAMFGNTAAAQALLAAGIPVDCVDSCGTTPLQIAAQENKRALIAALLKAGANPNANSEYGTPLCGLVANKLNCGPAIRLLMHAGAEPTLRGPDGRTPADIVKREFRYDKNTLLAILENPEKVTLQPDDEIDPPVMQRNPGESDYDFFRRQWRKEKSRKALSGFYGYVFQNDESLHHRDKLIEYLGEPTDGDDACMNYVAEDEHYFASFDVNPETGEIESCSES